MKTLAAILGISLATLFAQQASAQVIVRRAPIVGVRVARFGYVTAPLASYGATVVHSYSWGAYAAPAVAAPIVAAPVVAAPIVTAPVVTAPVVTAPVVAAPVARAAVVTSTRVVAAAVPPVVFGARAVVVRPRVHVWGQPVRNTVRAIVR